MNRRKQTRNCLCCYELLTLTMVSEERWGTNSNMSCLHRGHNELQLYVRTMTTAYWIHWSMQCLWKIWSHANKHYGGNHHLFAYNNIIRIWIVLLNTDRAAISYRKVSSFLQLWVIPWQWACLIQCNNSIALLIHVARDGGEYSRDLVGSTNQTWSNRKDSSRCLWQFWHMRMMHSVNRATNPATTSPIEWVCCLDGTQYNYSRNWIHIRQRTICRRDIVEMRINFINSVITA